MAKLDIFISDNEYNKNKAIHLAKALIFITLIILFIPSVNAEVTNLQVSPDNPNPGDKITISGAADTDSVDATVDFTKTVSVSKGEYSYTIEDVEIPKGDNTFRVVAKGVKDLKVDANVWWAPSLSSDASGGTASVGTSLVPSGTYKITISGNAQDGKSKVDLTIVASRILETQNSNFDFSYDTDPIPEGTFTLKVGDITKIITLGSPTSGDNDTDDSNDGDGGDDSSSSSGGTVGGGTTPDDLADNVEVSETEKRKMRSNQLVKSEFNKESNPVKYINITSKITTLDLRINVEVLKDTSTIVEKEPDGIVYKNLNIWVGYDGYATTENIINSTVEFKVDNNWIENNNIDPDSITLIHYNRDQKKWIELNTEKIKENDFDTYYIAHPSHFSPFAIIGHELSKGETKSENNNNNNNESGQSKVNDTPSGSENSKADINDSENLKSNGSSTDTNSTPNNNKTNANDSNMVLDNSYLSFLILIAVIGILGAVLLVKRR
ncbi:conserved hypothetical protein (plasmid) [Methanohalobium evestigatum Z-7303]|uniref:PGF-pre-PGF domain-containing protein n=1 Tax=Methanohalobium evestigatum (strain ATCC BAA-1072 / DSM 3721 / NBRC 107634 / OCM 161 / Z-7303) TaxID=644295 RepID=D7EC16_METEZ|nr:PGF-pre-PGF domain-containing protein [Methanohalobium evestigatum]ADI75138.1 conserved hypothetical protein [Methanohalobium evestigatum Z-7303]